MGDYSRAVIQYRSPWQSSGSPRMLVALVPAVKDGLQWATLHFLLLFSPIFRVPVSWSVTQLNSSTSIASRCCKGARVRVLYVDRFSRCTSRFFSGAVHMFVFYRARLRKRCFCPSRLSGAFRRIADVQHCCVGVIKCYYSWFSSALLGGVPKPIPADVYYTQQVQHWYGMPCGRGQPK